MLQTTVPGNPNISADPGGDGFCRVDLGFGVGQEAFVNDANIGNQVIGINMSPGAGSGIGAASSNGQTVQVTAVGPALCQFDNIWLAGDFIAPSAFNGGFCHDVGTTYPTSGQVIGIAPRAEWICNSGNLPGPGLPVWRRGLRPRRDLLPCERLGPRFRRQDNGIDQHDQQGRALTGSHRRRGTGQLTLLLQLAPSTIPPSFQRSS